MSSSSSKHRQPRLRASCDGCFLAKVKCSKTRPICSRCLACGIECRYSPSSRAGKPKADGSAGHAHPYPHHHHHSPGSSGPHHGASPVADAADMAAMAAAAGFTSMIGDGGMLYTATVPGMAGWHSPGGMETAAGASSRNHSVSSELAYLTPDESAAAMASAASGDIYGGAAATMPWTPPADMSMTQFSDSSLGGLPITSNTGYAMAAAASDAMPWIDPCSMDVFAYGHGHGQGQGQHQMPTPASSIASTNNYFPSPSATPSLRRSPAAGHKHAPLPSPSASSSGTGGSSSSSYHGHSQGSCACFTSCLHALQALHNASTPAAPPFDVVLALNRNAVDGCAAMLSCTRCMSRSGTHTAAMLLATVIGKVTSFYKHASQSYFTGEPAPGLDPASSALDPGPSVSAAADGSRHPSPSASSAPSVSLAPVAPAVPLAPLALTGLGVSLGAYHLQGEEGRWFELEILNRELKKLEDVYSRFCEVCGELAEDVEVSKAMIGYLSHSLGSTLNMVSHSRGEARFM